MIHIRERGVAESSEKSYIRFPFPCSENPGRSGIFSIVISLICFAYFMGFLIRYGEMLPVGSDIIGNVGYAMTLFGDIYRSGWGVPKPAHILVYGMAYWATRSFWFVNMVALVSGVLLIYYAFRNMGRNYGSLMPFLALAVLMAATPFFFGATLQGGSGPLSILFIFIALLYIDRLDSLKNLIITIVFLSMANLTRPENWVSTYLMIGLVFALKYLPGSRPKFDKRDLLFLIPVGMPVVWHLMDYAVFGDLFYSTNIAQRFAVVFGNSKNVFDWHKYPRMVGSSFFGALYLSPGLSVKTFGFIALFIVGIVTMFVKQRRKLLFMLCPFFGTIAFYFVTYVNRMSFMGRFLFYNYVFVLFALSIGIAQITGLFLRLPVRYLRNFMQVAAACLIVFSFAYKPFEKTMTMRPGFRNRSVALRKEDKAIRAIVNDVGTDRDDSIVATTLSIRCVRLALEWGSGKDLYSLIRLAAFERAGEELEKLGADIQKDSLPDLKGRTIYLGYQKSVGGDIKKFIQKMEKEAGSTETIFDAEGLIVRKCFY